MAGGRAADDRADGHDQPGHGGSGAHDRGARCRRGLAGPRDQVARALGAVEGGGVRAQGTRSREDRPADRRPAPCWSLFSEGRITEDTMARLARRLPAARDAELAVLVPDLMVSQLNRILRTCPEQPDGKPDPAPRPEPERFVGSYKDRDGWLRGEFCLPPAEGAELETALGVARDQEFRETPGPRRRHRRLVHHDDRGHLGRRVHAPRPRGLPTPSTRRSSAPVTAASAARSSSTTTSTPTAP